jgi:hypothetical protein
MTTRAQYVDSRAAELETFADTAHARALGTDGVTLDSAARRDANTEILKSETLPKAVQDVLAVMPEDQQIRVLDSIVVGANIFRQEHGFNPTGDMVQAALQQGQTAAKRIDASGSFVRDQNGKILDAVGSTDHHDQISAQPNRIVVAITSALAEAIPFAHYLPFDIGSNEARLGIVSHQAGTTFGAYTTGDLLDGVNIGSTYVSSERRVTLTGDAERDAYTGQITGIVGGSEDTPLLRGRTIISVNGFPCAFESPQTASSVADSPISGTFRIGSTTHVISGTVTVATGDVALAIAPAFPVGTVVEAEGFIDFEVAPLLAPRVLTQVQTYSYYANSWRVLAHQTVDSKTQYGNELGLDLQSENLIAIRNQVGMERHYMTLAKLKAIAVNNARTYDFDWSGQKQDKTRSQVWQDFLATLGIADQVMAEDTMDHGITHIYVGKYMMAQFQTLDSTIFQPSGITARPGIYRIGTLYGRYEVYYTPKGLTETGSGGQMLCIGRSSQVARCPAVLGDAVAPTFLPLAMDTTLKYSNAFYARNFTSVNQHVPSAKGAALINVTNLGMS